MAFFDTHLHLDFLLEKQLISLDELLAELQNNDVAGLLSLSIAKHNFASIMALAALAPEVFYIGLGLHPLYIEEHQEDDLLYLESLLSQGVPNLCAVGEIGLERYHPHLITPELWLKQCHFFETQLVLAKQYHLPVSVHVRRSKPQVLALLKQVKSDYSGIIHGFSGSYEEAKQFVNLGYKIGVGGVISYERSHKTREAIRRLPLESLLLETDSPDMPLAGFQGQPNMPMRIVAVFKALCELREEDSAVIQEQVWQNSLQLLQLTKATAIKK